MSERLKTLLEYEKRLVQDRQQLMELMEQCQGEDSQLVDYKLLCFQKEIAFMNHQLELMKAQAKGQSMAVTIQEQASQSTAQRRQEVQSATGQKMQFAEQMQQAGQMPSGQQEQSFTEQIQQAVQKSQQPEGIIDGANQTMEQTKASGEKVNNFVKKDLEKTIGRSLMGIFASVLIFISLILFATLLLPYFNDTAKMITTYVVSFAFLSVGLLKLRKDNQNKFFLALTGCGFGALYISLLLSNMYFKVLGDIPLYILICIWGVAVCFFSKERSRIFQIIGELGIAISILFGCLLCANTEDAAKYMALLIFYCISTAVFYVVHYEKEFNKNLIHHIFNVINLFFLLLTAYQIFEGGAEYLLLLVLTAVSVGSAFSHRVDTESISFGVIVPIYLFMTYSALEGMLGENETFGIILYITTIPMMALSEYKRMGHKEGKYILQIFLMIMAMVGLDYHQGLYDYGTVFLVVLPLLIGGFFRNNFVLKYGSLVMLCIYTMDTSFKLYEPVQFLLELIAFGAAFFLLWWKKEQYSRIFKYCLHLCAVWFLLYMLEDVAYELIVKITEENAYDISCACSYIIFTLFNIAMMKSVFGKNLKTGEAEAPILYNIINLISMGEGLVIIGDGNQGIWHILLILTTLGAFMINAKNLLDKRDNIFAGIYVGIKFTVLMVVVLNSFDSVNYVISISCLLMAIAAIVLGFVGQYKSLRVFGLVLSMTSIFKLIMIDISYENTLGNAISFFVSGILCFVISLIYNYIDGRFKKNEQSTIEDAKRA
ncbi:MAG: DUF2339 domain-containing protein [Lachnospiraceae bacterium]|nr:DUF2339 domain-containing protein [Lachnospiraceae bacterium]